MVKRKRLTLPSRKGKKTPRHPPQLLLATGQDPSNHPTETENTNNLPDNDDNNINTTSNDDSNKLIGEGESDPDDSNISSDGESMNNDLETQEPEEFSNIFDEKIESIVPKRDEFISSEFLTMERDDIYKYIHQTHINFNTRVGNNVKNQLSDLPIHQSTGKPITIPGTNHEYTASMKSFCTQWILNSEQSHVLKDSRTTDMYTVPLKNIVCSHDRTFITNLSVERATLESRDGIIHPYRYYVSFCSKISNQKNKFLKDIVVTFLQKYFETESARLMSKDVSNKSKMMNVIIVFDRGSEIIPRLMDDSTICSVILFSLHKRRPIVYIDYVCTNDSYVRGGLASMMINTAQHMAMTKFRSDKLVTDAQMSTFVNCSSVLSAIYAQYGFKKVNLKEISREANEYHGVFNHFEGKTWYDDTKTIDDQSMSIMVMDKSVPRWTNFLSYNLIDVERNLYTLSLEESNYYEISTNSSKMNKNNTSGNDKTSNSDKQSSSGSIRNNKQLSKAMQESSFEQFKDITTSFLESARYRNLVEEDITVYQASKSIGDFVGKMIAKKTNYFDVGEMYNGVYTNYQNNEVLFPEKHTMITKEMIRPLWIKFHPARECFHEKNMDSFPVWIELKCMKCKKSCYVKKGINQNTAEFLLRCIYTKWTTHVFGLSQSNSDEWNKVNVDWNICPSRKRSFFDDLKNAVIFDSQKPLSHLTQQESYNAQCNHLRILCLRLVDVYFEYVDALFGVACDVKQHLAGKRTCTKKTYKDSERLLMRAIGGTKSLVKTSQPSQKQSCADINDRIEAELHWSKEYYNDLTIQKKFKHLVYVDPEKIEFDRMFPDSQAYVKFYSSETYKKGKKKDRYVNEKLTHFVALTDSRGGVTRTEHNSLPGLTKNIPPGNDHVICEDYFVAKTEYGKPTPVRRITEKIVQRCKQNPNRAHKLTNDDLRLIKAHVQKTMAAGEIQKVRLLEKKENVPYQTESVLFKGKRHFSKIRFQGIDSQNTVHLLSDDWLKINFEYYRSFYEKIMSLEKYTGEYINVPVGKLKKGCTEWPFLKRDKGPPVMFQQKHENSCLFCSVASAFHILNETHIAEKIMSVYGNLNSDESFQPYEQNIIDILRNSHREKGERRIRVKTNKKNYTTIENLLNDHSHQIILVVLSNRHAICLVGNHVVDPNFEFCLPRTEKCLRVCAEITNHESSANMIKKVYSFDVAK